MLSLATEKETPGGNKLGISKDYLLNLHEPIKSKPSHLQQWQVLPGSAQNSQFSLLILPDILSYCYKF